MTPYDTHILLATYNGAKHLPVLLQSLDEQYDQHWKLVVRDDGSQDDTVKILKKWGEAHPDRFEFLDDEKTNLGAMGNFSALLGHCDADYFLLCDQDDFWLPEKVGVLKLAIKQQEEALGADTPIIVHTDLIVVDEALKKTSDSYFDYQGLKQIPENDPWKLLALQNVVTGCAMIGNQALLRKAIPISAHAMMHDWWLALVCGLKGKIHFLSEPSILYRQHGSNTLGARKWSFLQASIQIAAFPFNRKLAGRLFAKNRKQANALLEHFGDELTHEQAQFFSDFARLNELSILEKNRFFSRNKMKLRGVVRNVGLRFLR